MPIDPQMPGNARSDCLEKETAASARANAAGDTVVPGIETFITQIVKDLVDSPDQVEVSVLGGLSTNVIELRVARNDLGKVIGKRGKTADAMRTLLNAVCSKARMRAILEIID